MPFNLLFNVWIVFLIAPRSPVILAIASQSKPLEAERSVPTRAHA